MYPIFILCISLFAFSMLIKNQLVSKNLPEYSLMQASSADETDQSDQPDQSDELVYHADDAGHFRGTISINNVSMPFMIDTGATKTTIPMKLARKAGLPLGPQVEIKTAGGKVFGKSTKIKSLKFGIFEINNIDAHVNSNLSEVLIGMNTLKYFKITQTVDTLKLTLNKEFLDKDKTNSVKAIERTDENPQPQNNAVSKPIKSSVICDNQNHCITKYDNE